MVFGCNIFFAFSPHTTSGAYADQLIKLCFTVFTILLVTTMFTVAEVGYNYVLGHSVALLC